MEEKKMNSQQIEGRNAVMEAFRSGKPIDKVYILDGCQDGPIRSIVREAKKHDTILNFVTKERLNQISETGRHQGVIAQAAAYEYAQVEDMLELAKQMECEKKQIVVGYRDAHTFLKEEFEQAGEQQWEALCQEYETDSRTGVKNLTARYRKKQQALVQERERLEVMKTFERKYADYSFICGIDEAGRGPLAGPVVAGAVILPKDCEILYLNDSKKLSAAKREELYDEIMEKAVAAAVGMASPARIDEINILQATYEAMREAISKLAVEPGILLNDAVTIPEMIIPQVPIIKGDAKSVSIAAASILAKVTRDRLMVEYDKVMPEYGFAGHKGYGSKEHIEAIKKYGPTPIHRKTFIKKFI